MIKRLNIERLLKIINVIIMAFLLFTSVSSVAQVLSVGYKYQEKGMFQATFNYPFLFSSSTHHELMLGVDYTSKNDQASSGLTPQFTYGYYIIDNADNDYTLMVGISTGCNFNFNSTFENQFKVTPFVYTELMGLLNVKVGVDYSVQLQKGYPFLSLGLGGLHLFRHLKMM